MDGKQWLIKRHVNIDVFLYNNTRDAGADTIVRFLEDTAHHDNRNLCVVTLYNIRRSAMLDRCIWPTSALFRSPGWCSRIDNYRIRPGLEGNSYWALCMLSTGHPLRFASRHQARGGVDSSNQYISLQHPTIAGESLKSSGMLERVVWLDLNEKALPTEFGEWETSTRLGWSLSKDRPNELVELA